MARRWITTDSANPTLPEDVIDASQEAMLTVHNTDAFNLQTGGTPRFNVAAGTPLFWYEPKTGSIFFGPNYLFRATDQTMQRSLPDGVFDMTKLRWGGRVITLADIADPADLDGRRFGPEQVNGHTSYPYIGDAHDLGEHGTWEDLTGLGSGSLVFQIRSTPARVPYGGDPDTAGGACVESGAVIGFQTSEMPRQITPNNQMAVGMRVYFALVPNGSQDKIEVLNIENNGHLLVGAQAVAAGDGGALLQVRTHAGVNAKNTVTITGTPTGGSITLTVYKFPSAVDEFPASATTASIAYNANAAAVQTAIVNAFVSLGAVAIPGTPTAGALYSNVTSADVTVTGGPGPGTPWVVEFTGRLGLHRQVKLEATSSLTGGTSPAVSVSETVAGIDHELGNRIVNLRGTTGQTTDYIRVLNGAGGDVLSLDKDGILQVPVQATVSGVLRHTGSTAGFFGAAAVTQRAAYTQTYSTATRTHANFTSGDLTGITSSTTGTALAEPGAAYSQATDQQNLRRIQDQFNALRADLANLKQLVNSLVDDNQALGFAT